MGLLPLLLNVTALCPFQSERRKTAACVVDQHLLQPFRITPFVVAAASSTAGDGVLAFDPAMIVNQTPGTRAPAPAMDLHLVGEEIRYGKHQGNGD